MPIIGLTDRMPAFPRVGKIRKGGPKGTNRPGQDLNEYFRLDSDDPGIVAKFNAAYSDKPKEIDVILPFATPEENLSSWMEHWVAGGLVHRCDGKKCVVKRNKEGTYDRWDIGDPDAPDCPGECSATGRLAVVLPKLERLVSLTVETHSLNDIMNLSSNLQAYYALRGNLAGIAFVLRRVKRKISTPGQNGKRVSREKWLLQLEPAPEWVARQMIAMQQRAMPKLTVDDDLSDIDINELLFDVPPKNGNNNPSADAPTEEELIEPDLQAGEEEIVEGESEVEPEFDIEALTKKEFCNLVIEKIPFYANLGDITNAWGKIGNGRKFEDLSKAALFAELDAYANLAANLEVA